MGALAELPTELILHIISFLTPRKAVLDPMRLLPSTPRRGEAVELIPDVPSINALSQTNSVLHHTLDETLYTLGASVEALGRLALLFAVEHDLLSTFDKLVAAGVSIDGQSTLFKYGRPCTLLHVAADTGSCLIISKLLELYGEEMLAMVYTHDTLGRTALDYAVSGGHMEAVRLLTPILAVPNSIGDGALVADEFLEAHKEYLSRALLKSVSRNSNAAICEHLISEGADVNIRDNNYMNSSPLFYASGNDNLAGIQVLLAAGADPNLGDRNGVVPLFNVADIPAAEALLAAGADIRTTDIKARNILAHRPVEYPELLRFIIERGVNLNHQDSAGETPLHHACRTAGIASIRLLLQFGAATVEKADHGGVTPVDLAMRTGKIEVVRFLRSFVHSPTFKSEIATWLEEQEGEDMYYGSLGPRLP